VLVSNHSFGNLSHTDWDIGPGCAACGSTEGCADVYLNASDVQQRKRSSGQVLEVQKILKTGENTDGISPQLVVRLSVQTQRAKGLLLRNTFLQSLPDFEILLDRMLKERAGKYGLRVRMDRPAIKDMVAGFSNWEPHAYDDGVAASRPPKSGTYKNKYFVKDQGDGCIDLMLLLPNMSLLELEGDDTWPLAQNHLRLSKICLSEWTVAGVTFVEESTQISGAGNFTRLTGKRAKEHFCEAVEEAVRGVLKTNGNITMEQVENMSAFEKERTDWEKEVANLELDGAAEAIRQMKESWGASGMLDENVRPDKEDADHHDIYDHHEAAANQHFPNASFKVGALARGCAAGAPVLSNIMPKDMGRRFQC